MAKKKKNKHAVVFSVWATIAQLYPGRNTFEFDQESTNHSAHFVEWKSRYLRMLNNPETKLRDYSTFIHLLRH